MFTTETMLQAIVSGLLMGCIYSLVAVGLCLIWGLMEIVNFAHGEMLMLSMFTAFWMFVLFHVDPLLSLPLCIVLLFLVGVLTYLIIIKRILKAPFLAQILATFGLGIFLRNLAQYLWTPDFRMVKGAWLTGRIDLGGVFVGLPELVASLSCVAAFLFLFFFINRTEVGIALLATSEDREAASLMGINGDRMFALGWGLGAACLGLAGGLMANFYYIFPEVGFPFALIAYVAVALGGFGSIPGAFLAGLIIGLVEVFAGLLVSPSFKYTFVFLVYLVVVFVRPQGMFGRY